MSKKETWFDVVTTKRTWSTNDPHAKVTWEPDEEVVSIDVREVEDGKGDR